MIAWRVIVGVRVWVVAGVSVGLEVEVRAGVSVKTLVTVAVAVLVGVGTVGVRVKAEAEVGGKAGVDATSGANTYPARYKPRQQAPNRSRITSNFERRPLFLLTRLICIIPPLRHRCLDFDV